MPLIDKPLEELKSYMGINPCPKDFDEFWDKSLAELAAIDPKVDFEPYDLKSNICDAYHLTFTSTKGARIHAKFLKPKNIEGRVPALLKFHGLSGNAGNWFDLIPYAAEGYVIASLDVRGQGGFSEDVGGVPGTTITTPFIKGIDGKPEDLLYRDIFLDTAMLARVVMALDYVDEGRIGVYGGSQGGALSIACAALVPEIKLCAPDFPYLSDYKRVWEMDLDKGAYEGIRYYLRYFDPTHERVDEFFEKLGYIDIQFLAKRVRAKVFIATGLMDTICPPSTQFAMFNKLICEKEMVIYPDFGHETLYGHEDKKFKFFSQI